MATLQTADGRLLRSRPAGIGMGSGSLFPSSFPPMWSDGEEYRNGLTDGLDGPLVSFNNIYRSQPVLAGVVDKIARRAATLPVGVFTENEDGSRTAVPRENGLATLLRRPRPGQAGVHLFAHIFQSLLVNPGAVVAKVRSHGDPDLPPDMLWPLDWQHMNAYGPAGGDIEWWGTTQFGNPQTGAVEERFIRAQDVILFSWPGPDGGQIGVSPLEKLGVTIKLEDASQRFQTSSFRNGNRPSLAVTLDNPKPSREVLDLTRRTIEALHKGVDQNGKTILLGAGSKIQPLSLSPVEAALIEQRRLNREEVAIVYDLAGPSLSDTTNSSMGNVVERMRSFYRDVLPPWTTLVVETLEAQLVEPEPAWMGLLVRFDFTDKLRGEPLEQAQVHKTLTEAGLETRNEARQKIGYGPAAEAGADQLTVNANNQDALANLENSGE